MLLLKFDEHSRRSKTKQIIEQIKEKIETRKLRPGEKLPSTRQLANRMGIHRSTVAIAYQELWALGFIDLYPGACPRVRDRMQMATTTNSTKKSVIDWKSIASAGSNAIWQDYLGLLPQPKTKKGPAAIDFSRLDMDRRLMPYKNFCTSLHRAIRTRGVALLGYSDHPTGFLPLREYVAHRLQTHGISVDADEILLTNGSQQGIDLVLRMIASPGKTVAIESPTYGHVHSLIRFLGLKALEIPIRSDGMDLSALADGLIRHQPVLVYTIPNFQNPTGVSTTQTHREKLLSLCQQHRIPILEDGFEEEMKYFGRVVLPIKSMDRHHLVIYCGTFSKVLFPGVRIGWIAAHRECIERLTAIRRFSDLSSSAILQAAIYEFCHDGFYDRHINKMHRIFRKRMQTTFTALRRYISPQWAEWSEPSGGYLIWLKLLQSTPSSADWEALQAKYGVKIAHGSQFFFSATPSIYLRLSISTLDETEIVEGIQRLSRALRYVYTRRQP